MDTYTFVIWLSGFLMGCGITIAVIVLLLSLLYDLT